MDDATESRTLRGGSAMSIACSFVHDAWSSKMQSRREDFDLSYSLYLLAKKISTINYQVLF
jgi:hypothetical protein